MKIRICFDPNRLRNDLVWQQCPCEMLTVTNVFSRNVVVFHFSGELDDFSFVQHFPYIYSSINAIYFSCSYHRIASIFFFYVANLFLFLFSLFFFFRWLICSMLWCRCAFFFSFSLALFFSLAISYYIFTFRFSFQYMIVPFPPLYIGAYFLFFRMDRFCWTRTYSLVAVCFSMCRTIYIDSLSSNKMRLYQFVFQSLPFR